MKRIFFNTVKISLAAIFAVLTALFLHLDFAVSAGIVAILSVQATKKETIKTASARLFAFIAALIISVLLFNILGFTITTFFIYLVIFICICQWRKWLSAMAMDSVLISHFLTFKQTGFTEIKNEIFLFAIGVTSGILANIFLHKKTDYIESLKSQSDEKIKNTLHRMSLRILNPTLEDYDGSCFLELNKSIFTAKKQAEENFNNQFSHKDTYDTLYIAMREKQIKVLQEMFKSLQKIKTVPHTGPLAANFLEKVSVEFHRDNDVKSLIEELENIRNIMKIQLLPQNRTEFEDRANLYIVLERMEEFLYIKKEFINSNKYYKK